MLNLRGTNGYVRMLGIRFSRLRGCVLNKRELLFGEAKNEERGASLLLLLIFAVAVITIRCDAPAKLGSGGRSCEPVRDCE
jgi:hypothetical protein